MRRASSWSGVSNPRACACAGKAEVKGSFRHFPNRSPEEESGSILGDASAADGRQTRPEPVRVRIAGGEYVLRGPGSPAHLRELASELDRRLQAVIDRNPRLALHQAAVLCALEILDELASARAQPKRARGHPDASRRTGRTRR